MPLAILFLITGIVLAASALKGKSVSDLLNSGLGSPFSPNAGGSNGTAGKQQLATYSGGGSQHYAGQNAVILETLDETAREQFGLSVSRCRSSVHNAAVGGAAQSNHLADADGKCRAFDASGNANSMKAYALYVKANYPQLELFYDPIGLVAPGFDHSDHVHTGSDR